MLTSAFPSYTLAFPDLPDGKFVSSRPYEYQPHMALPKDLLWDLSQILAEAREFENEGENPAVLADWVLIERAKTSSLLYHSHISFFRDGCDGAEKNEHWENIGVLFYRQDLTEDLAGQGKTSNPSYSRVHIPELEWQDRLIDACDYQADLQRGDRRKLDMIVRYLAAILNDQTTWIERSTIF